MVSRQRLQKSFDGCTSAQQRLALWCDDPELLQLHAPKVSAWTIGLHVEHLSKTAALILDFLERFLEVGGEKGWGKRPNVVGWMVLLSRFIPRGSADVPDFLCPIGVDMPSLLEELKSTDRRLEGLGSELETLAAMSGTQPHPLLGHFTVIQWFDFLVIHDHHHYKIVRDIARVRGVSVQ